MKKLKRLTKKEIKRVIKNYLLATADVQFRAVDCNQSAVWLMRETLWAIAKQK